MFEKTIETEAKMVTGRRSRKWFSIVWRAFSLLIFVALGVQWSLLDDDWTWFSRSGSCLVALSILYLALAYFSDTLTGLYKLRDSIARSGSLSDEEMQKSSLEAVVSRYEDAMLNYFTAVFGGFFGTIIWGFGDLIGRWF